MRETQVRPWVRKISWRRKWQPTPVLLPGKFHGQRSLAGYSPWGCKESDTTERLQCQCQGQETGLAQEWTLHLRVRFPPPLLLLNIFKFRGWSRPRQYLYCREHQPSKVWHTPHQESSEREAKWQCTKFFQASLSLSLQLWVWKVLLCRQRSHHREVCWGCLISLLPENCSDLNPKSLLSCQMHLLALILSPHLHSRQYLE